MLGHIFKPSLCSFWQERRQHKVWYLQLKVTLIYDFEVYFTGIFVTLHDRKVVYCLATYSGFGYFLVISAVCDGAGVTIELTFMEEIETLFVEVSSPDVILSFIICICVPISLYALSKWSKTRICKKFIVY